MRGVLGQKRPPRHATRTEQSTLDPQLALRAYVSISIIEVTYLTDNSAAGGIAITTNESCLPCLGHGRQLTVYQAAAKSTMNTAGTATSSADAALENGAAYGGGGQRTTKCV